MTQARSVSVHFTQVKHTIHVPILTGGEIEVSYPGSITLCGRESCNIDVPEGENVTFTALADAEFGFQSWQGDCASTTAECSLTIDSARSISASFESTKSYSATVSWEIPTTRENGDPLEIEDIGGYEIRYKHESDDSFQYRTVTEASTKTLKIENLSSGEYEFTVATFDREGLYSDYSDPSYKTF
jgi:hypothetical protein